MDLMKEFLEASTIHGLAHISTARSPVAKAAWVITVTVSFGFSFYMITNSWMEWDNNPVSTTITTHPVDDLAFPKITVCPPNGSNTVLNFVLERVQKNNLSSEERIQLKNISNSVFVQGPFKKYAEELVASVNLNNLRSLYNGQSGLPVADHLYTFSINSSSVEGSFSTPGFFDETPSGDFYLRSHHHRYHLEFPENLAALVGDGSLRIEVETKGQDVNEWKFMRQKRVLLYRKLQTWAEAESTCVGLGGHLPSIHSDEEQKEIQREASSEKVWLGGSDEKVEAAWTWSDSSSWDFDNWTSGQPDNENWATGNGQDMVMMSESGFWEDMSSGDRCFFICQTNPTKMTGNYSFEFTRDDLFFLSDNQSFTLWWSHIPSDNDTAPGLRLSWYIETNVVSDNMKLVSSGNFGQISTPNFGANADSEFYSRSHAFHAFISLPLNETNTVENGTLSINIEVPADEDLVGRVEFWTGSKARLRYYGEKKLWQEAEDFCVGSGGHLASVVWESDNEKLNTLVKSRTEGEQFTWLGMTDPVVEKIWPHAWEWSNGDNIEQTFWDDGEPNGDHEKCVIMDPQGTWRDMMCQNSDWRYPFICQQEAVRVNSSMNFTFPLKGLNFTHFQVLWRSPSLNETAERPKNLQGFKLSWNASDSIGNREPYNENDVWKLHLPPMYMNKNKALIDMIELASLARKGNLSLDSVWQTVVNYKTTWVHGNRHRTSWCMDSITEAGAIEEIKTSLNVKDVKDIDGISSVDLEFGVKIFSVLHYCPNYVVEASKIAIFYEHILEEKSLRTIIQTTMNLMSPEYETDNLKTVKSFFSEMDKMFKFSLESPLIALTNTEDIGNLMEESLPYLENHKINLKECLENENCDKVKSLTKNIGAAYSMHKTYLIFCFFRKRIFREQSSTPSSQ